MKKILTIVGARPQFIKAAAFSRAAAKFPVEEIIVHTGQHFDKNMSEVFFEEMEIPRPHYNLDIHSLSHGAMTGRMLEKLEEVMLKEKPDVVLVYGDTNSTLAGALAAKKLHIKVAHVEAGLRSFNMSMPEEINRILTDRISDYLFCPTQNAIQNLEKEGFSDFPNTLVMSGDVMYDTALFYKAMSDQKSNILVELNLKNEEFVLATLHRQENTDNPVRLKNIVDALNEINTKTRVILPLHPRTRNILASEKLTLNFDTISPLGYFDIIQLLSHSRMVLTDSGGMQKEAYFFKKICLTLRDETEWVELVANGVNQLTGAEKGEILSNFDKYFHEAFPSVPSLYGEGKAAELIVELLSKE